jgi:hypothetical protein
VIYQDRSGFGAAEGSGVQCAIYDIGAHAWVTDFDAGANIIAQTGWDSTQTLCTALNTRTYMDAAGNVGVFPNTSSLQTVPVIWINRYFYQRILLDNSLGSFFDFPGQVQPLTPAPPFGFGAQDLVAFSGSADRPAGASADPRYYRRTVPHHKPQRRRPAAACLPLYRNADFRPGLDRGLRQEHRPGILH